MHGKAATGHAIALFTACVWGVTYVSTKALLEDFAPVEILFTRFLMGLAALWLLHPGGLRGTTRRQELTFAAAGLCGICLYYLLENIALTFTQASNVGIIVSTVPLFTALFERLFFRDASPLGARFLLGFAVAMAGICLIMLNGHSLQLNPAGDLLALAGSATWAVYSLIVRRMNDFGLPMLPMTRRTFLYGLLFMLPAIAFTDVSTDLARFTEAGNIAHMIFLGVVASAVCFASWNAAIRHLGAVRASTYIYLVPVITLVSARILLGEPLTPLALGGAALTVAGLALSQTKREKAPA